MKSKLLLFATAAILLVLCIKYEIVSVLLFGWISFLWRVLPNVETDSVSIATGVIASSFFVLLTQYIGSWFWKQRKQNQREQTERDASSKWKWRWSMALSAILFFMFVSGTAIVGIVHQTIWQFTSPAPAFATRPDLSGNSHWNMKQFELAVSISGDTNKNVLRSGDSESPHGSSDEQLPVHSWATKLLPFLNYVSDRVDIENPWDHVVNRDAFSTTPECFLNPDFRTVPIRNDKGFGLCHYAANPNAIDPASGLFYSEFPRKTILIGEVNRDFRAWGDPANVRDPVEGINRSPNSFGGPPGTGGALFLMSDFTIEFLPNETDLETLRKISGASDANGKSVQPN